MPSDQTRDASTVMLVRHHEGRREFFWVRRSREVSLGGGFYAFPGGRIDEADKVLAQSMSAQPDAALRVAAIRELFEESGVLLASTKASHDALSAARKALLDQRGRLTDALKSLGEPSIDLATLHFAGRWITPLFLPVRFDARFFVAEMPAGQSTEVWPGELVDGEWITPESALERWEKGRALLHPPALHLIRCLRDAPFPECLERMQRPPSMIDFVAERIEFQAGVLLCPVRTPTIPPATHTNCYLVGEDELVIIDPASPYEDEQKRLAALCDSLIAEGRRFREILVTHHHHDHVGGVRALSSHLHVPVRAHARTAEMLRADQLPVDGLIEPNEVIALPGRLGLRLRAVFTPGHAVGHFCFFEESTGALFAGDMVAGIGSIVVLPSPDGSMSQYMASLRQLQALHVSALYPSHGPTIPDGPRKIAEYIAHREDREARIGDALKAAGKATAHELVPAVYTDVDPSYHALAARSLEAVLEKLVEDGRASVDQERYAFRA